MSNVVIAPAARAERCGPAGGTKLPGAVAKDSEVAATSHKANEGMPTVTTGTRAPNPLSYPKATEPFSAALFKKPTSEYRGNPLAAWNGKLDKGRLLRQVDAFEQMGFGGFFMHVRTGLDTQYMSTEFMDLVEETVKYAEKKGMHACLYDEDRWPSGAAGGKVVEQNPEHKGMHLLFTPRPYGSMGPPGDNSPASAHAARSENGKLLAKYLVAQDDMGCLRYWSCVKGDDEDEDKNDVPEEAKAYPHRQVWYAYAETNPPGAWFNGQTYVDTLSPAAMAKFVEITHEVYRAQAGVGSRFGGAVPAIFTDEPQFATKTRLPRPTAGDDVFLPWTGDILDTFREAYGKDADLLAQLPEVVWDLPGGEASVTRYRFHDHVCERFVSAFMDQLSSWCERYGIYLTGHMMDEPTLDSQTGALGEAMRCYRSMQLPGIDLLNDSIEYNTAKQASSMARQRGLRGAFTEIYGCTHWFFPFEGHKGCGDWQAALGITSRSPHLAWLGMKGEAKRDYPASINHQSPWFREYGPVVEDHFARVAIAMTRGRPVTRIAVVHPVESFWLCYGPNESPSGDEMRFRDGAFGELTDWLLHALLDFDFICESELPAQFGDDVARGCEGGKLRVGHCRYDVVVLPNLRTIRGTTLDIVHAFARAGGRVIIAGRSPSLVDAREPSSSEVWARLGLFERIPWRREEILAKLEPHRELGVNVGNMHKPAQSLLYQMREDGDERFVFICNEDRNNGITTKIALRGTWPAVEIWDTLTGESRPVAQIYHTTDDGWTHLFHRFEGCGSVLLRLLRHPSASSHQHHAWTVPPAGPRVWLEMQLEIENKRNLCRDLHYYRQKLDLVGSALSEPNVLVLDFAEYKLDDDEEWSGATEVLRIDNQIRDRLRLPRKGGSWKQPWAVPQKERKALARLTMRFSFRVETGKNDEADALKELSKLALALEDPTEWKLSVNGTDFSVSDVPEGWWVDEDIRVVPLPKDALVSGRNTIVLEGDFNVLTNTERIYLLGHGFHVSLTDRSSNGDDTTCKSVLKPGLDLDRLGWGNIVDQGLPFYAGNVVYRTKFALRSRSPRRVVLSVPNFSSTVLKCRLFVDDSAAAAAAAGKEEEEEEEEAGLSEKKRTPLREGHIAYQPRRWVVGEELDPGHYELEITAFGNRFNSFGHFHVPEGIGGCWPDMWRTGGGSWSDNYVLKPIGVLESPELLIEDKKGSAPASPSLLASSSGEGRRLSAEWELVHDDGDH